MDALFSDLVLQEMRALNEANLPHRGRLQDRSRTRQPGGVTEFGPWADVLGAEYPCRLVPVGRTATERTVADQVSAVAQWTVVFPAGTPVEPAHRIVVEGETAGAPWTKTVYVVGVVGPHSHEAIRRVLCTEEEPR